MTAHNFREVHVSIVISAYREEAVGGEATVLLREDVPLEEFAKALAREISDGICGGSMVHTRRPKKPKVSV